MSFETRQRWLLAGLTVAVVFIAGWPGLDNGFINYDDPDVIVNNPRLDDPGVIDVGDLFFEVRDHAYLPLYYLALMPEAAIAGKDPEAFHVASLLWHALNAVLVFFLVRRITTSLLLSAAAAMVFAAHPVAVESVAWASGRKDQVSLMFLLWGLHVWMGFCEGGGATRFVGAALLFFLGCFGKGSVVVFPALAGLIALQLHRDGRLSEGRRPWLAVGILAAVAVVPVAVHLVVAAQEGVSGAGTIHGPGDGALMFLGALRLYAQHLVLPVALSIHYHLPAGAPFGLEQVTGLLVLGVLGVGTFLFMKGRGRWVAFAAAWLLVSLAPFNDVFPRTSLAAADRYLAVGLPAFGLFIGALLSRLPAQAGWVGLLAIVGLLATLSMGRTMEFVDGETVFRRAMEVDPGDPLPPAQVAEALLERSAKEMGRPDLIDEALGMLALSLGLAEREHDPLRTMRARLRYADTLLRTGRYQTARDEFGSAITELERDPERYVALGVRPLTLQHNLAQCMLGLGLVHDAKAQLLRILDLDKEHPHARLTLAGLHMREGFRDLERLKRPGLVDRARTQVNRGISDLIRLRGQLSSSRITGSPWSQQTADELEPKALKELGEGLLHASWREGSESLAVECGEFLTSHYPDRAHGWLLLSRIKEAQGESAREVLLDLAKAHHAAREDVDIIVRFATKLLSVGENRKAMSLLLRARALRPESETVKVTLGRLFVALGRTWHNQSEPEKALRAAQQGTGLLPRDPDAWLLRGQVMESQRRWKDAGTCYANVLEYAPDQAQGRLGIARCYQAQGIAALSQLEKRVAKTDAEKRGSVRQHLTDLVVSQYRLALEYAAGASDVNVARSWLRAHRARTDDASQQLREQGWAQLVSGGDRQTAIGLLEQATAMDGLDLEAHWMLAEALRARSRDQERDEDARRADRDRALVAVEHALSLDPEHVQSLYLVSDLYYVKGRWKKLVPVARRFLVLVKDDPEIADRRAHVARRLELALQH
ncbi:MAG: hypothetical protein CL908_11815 [Deltaproteobacteria bacterium]|nr:hypothetical protein [Deltaproteobacteria bacterium]